MSKAVKVVAGVAVVAGAAVGVYYLVQYVAAKRSAVDDAVSDVELRLDELDPLSRAAAVAKLTKDEADALSPSNA